MVTIYEKYLSFRSLADVYQSNRHCQILPESKLIITYDNNGDINLNLYLIPYEEYFINSFRPDLLIRYEGAYAARATNESGLEKDSTYQLDLNDLILSSMTSYIYSPIPSTVDINSNPHSGFGYYFKIKSDPDLNIYFPCCGTISI